MPSLDDLTWPVRTERLLLRRACAHDADAVWRYRSRPEVWEWLTRAETDPDAFNRRFQQDWLDDQLIVEHEHTVVGDVMVRIGDAWAQQEVTGRGVRAQAELGYAFDPDQQGKGFATEALRAVIALCLTPAPGGLGLHRITAELFADNLASRRLLERVDMRLETHARRDSLHRSRGWLDGMSFALLAEEFTRPAG